MGQRAIREAVPPRGYAAPVTGLLLTTALLLIANQHASAQPAGGAGGHPAPHIAEPAIPVAQPWPNDSSWRQIGPAAFGGRVDDIEAVPSDPRIIFVGTASGGVFRSTNNGVTWDPVFDHDGRTLSIGDIAIAPSDPRVVWVGTGEANNRQSSTWGDGVYRSTDGGTTWQHMGLRETQTIGRILIDPQDPNTVFVAAVGHLFGPNEERGVYRTKDGGATWQKILGVDANTGATDLVMTPDGRTLVAATYQRRRRAFGFAGSGPGSGLWRSTDGGDHWSRITTGVPTGDLGRIGLTLSPSSPNVLYATIEAFPPGGGVYRSDDGGASWTRVNRSDPRADYFSQIRVDPGNPEHVWLLGTALEASHDGGKTFSTDSIDPTAHPDHHAMWIDPAQPAHVMLGNDGGVYFSYDDGRHWTYVDNLPIGQFYDIAIDQRDPYWIYGGAQDNGSWAFPSATYSRGGMTNSDVVNTAFGDGFQAAVDRVDPQFVYANSQNGRGFLTDMVTHEERFIQPLAHPGEASYRFNWNTGIAQSAEQPRAYFMGAQKLLVTTDRGQSWREISPDLTRNLPRGKQSVGDGFPVGRSLSMNDGTSAYGNITTISVSPLAAGTIYVGTDDGNVQMTTDGGAHWTNLTARFHLPRPVYVSKVLASRHGARVAYVCFDGHWDDDMAPYVFRTTDGGATWHPVVGDLPGWKPVKTIEEDPVNPALLFAGTEFGLYWTPDGGAHWSAPPGNVPPVMVDRVIVNPRNHDLILGTHGRSVIILEDIAPLEQGSAVAARGDVQLFPARSAREVQTFRDLPWPSSGRFVAPNSPIGTYVSYRIASDPPRPDSVRIQVVGADGDVVNEMTGPDAAGTHRVLWNLRYRFRYVPPPEDSGFYGPPRAPYVPPGDYTIKLIARGQTLTQPVHVGVDPRAPGTPAALRARIALDTRGRALDGVYYDLVKSLEPVDSELAALRTAADHRPDADSAIAKVAREAATLRQRARGNSITSGLGRLFDLLAAIESSSLPPTDAQERSMRLAQTEFDSLSGVVHTLVTRDLPALRARVSGAAAGGQGAAGAGAARLSGEAQSGAPLPHDAASPEALAQLVMRTFSSGTPEAFAAVYPDSAGRVFMREARGSVQRETELARVVEQRGSRAVLLLGGVLRTPEHAERDAATGSDETNGARHFSGFYEAVDSAGRWHLTHQIPFDSTNFLRTQNLHVDVDPGTGIQVVDSLQVSVGVPYGLGVRLNNAVQLRDVRLNGTPAVHALGGGVLWIQAPASPRSLLVLSYTLAAARPRGADTAAAAGAMPAYGAFHNTDAWHPFFDYLSANQLAQISATVRIPAAYYLTTTVPQTDTVRHGVRTVYAHSLHPEFLLALIYDRDWQPRTTDFGSFRFQSFTGPGFRHSHDSLAAVTRRVYDLLAPRFGEPQFPSRYLAAVQDRTLGPGGFTVRMNNAAISGTSGGSLGSDQSQTFAHETGHAWTLNATGHASNFLHEAWATFVEALMLRAQYGPADEQAFWERQRNAYMVGNDRRGFAGGMEGQQSILANYDNGRIHYRKGSWILRSANHVLGDSVFDRGMRLYIDGMGKGPAGYQELDRAWSTAAGHDMSSFLMPWLTSKYIPDVAARVEDHRLIVTQQQPGELFDLPRLDIDLTTAAGTARRLIHLAHRADTLDLGGAGAVTGIAIDPDHEFLLMRHLGEPVVRFALPASRAPAGAAVALAGDFVRAPIPATREGDDWVVELPMTEGRYTWAWQIGADARNVGADPTLTGVRVVQPLQVIANPYPGR